MTNPEFPSPKSEKNNEPGEESTPVTEPMPDYRVERPESTANIEGAEKITSLTLASKTLTRLIGGILSDSTPNEALNGKSHSDHLKFELLKDEFPLKQEEIDAFSTLLKPITAKLEKMGISEYCGMPNLKNPYAYTKSEGRDSLTFNALYTPWSYVNGKLSLKVDINKLRKVVEKMPEKTELDRQKKQQALLELDTFEVYIDNEVMSPTPEEDRYDEPSPEHLNELAETLDQIDEDLIVLVNSLPDAITASASEERKKLNKASGRIAIIIDYLKANTKIALDKDKTQYPEFWLAVDKHRRIKTAVGSTNLSTNTIRRDN